MRVLVTGASGWIGSVVVADLAGDLEVRCVDIAAAPAGMRSEWLCGDLADRSFCELATAGVDAVVHLAAGRWTDAEPGPDEALTGSVLATANLMAAAVDAGVKRCVLMSSCAVVAGYPRPSSITVDMPHSFSNLYGLAKSLQEQVTSFYAQQSFDALALRPWSVVDSRTSRWKDGRALLRSNDLYSHDGHFGLICRYDVASATRAALTAEVNGFQPLHLMATRAGRACFDVELTERTLNWTPAVDFAELAPSQAP